MYAQSSNFPEVYTAGFGASSSPFGGTSTFGQTPSQSPFGAAPPANVFGQVFFHSIECPPDLELAACSSLLLCIAPLAADDV